MVWDATKAAGDLIASSDWNAMVSDQKGHAARHGSGGADEITIAESQISDLSHYTSSDFDTDFSGKDVGALNNVSVSSVASGQALVYDGSNWANTDVATQTELNSHSGDSDAHHSKTTSATDLTDVSADSVSDAHHAKYTDEEVDDRVNNLLTGGSNVSLSYDDGANSLTISATDTDTTYTSGSGLLLSSQEFSLDENYGPTWTSEHTFNAPIVWRPGNRPVLRFDSSGSGTQQNGLFEFRDENNSNARTGWFGWYESGNAIRFTNTNTSNYLALSNNVDINTDLSVSGNISVSGNVDGVDISSHAGSSSAHHSKTSSASELSDVSADSVSDAHHAKYTDEEAQDAVNSLLVGGTNVTLSYDDAANSLTIDAAGGTDTRVDVEDDGTAVVSDVSTINFAGGFFDVTNPTGSDVNVTISNSSIGTTQLSFDPATQTELNNHTGNSSAHHSKYTDADAQSAINNDADHGSTASHNYFSGAHDDLTSVGASDHHSKYTDEEAQDAVGNIMSGSGATTVTYDDAGNTITVSSTDNNTTYSAGSGLDLSGTTFSLTNDTVTVAGNAVALGGSTGIALGDISDTSLSSPASGQALVYNGTSWANTDVATQTELDNHSGTSGAHHSKTTSATDLTDVSADSVSDAHHAKYTDGDAQSAINNDADHGSTASHNYFSGSHDDLTNVSSSDHHSKTSSLSEISDSGALAAKDSITTSDVATGTLVLESEGIGSNDNDTTIPTSAAVKDYVDTNAGGTDTRVNIEDDGTAVVSNASILNFQGGYFDVTNPSGTDVHVGISSNSISATELSFDPATQTELNNHAGNSSAHHSKTTSASDLTDVSADSVSDAHHAKYTDSDAQSAINNDADHGSTASHNYTTSLSGITDSGALAAKDSVASGDIDTDAVGTDELDLSVSPTWTSDHTFSGKVNVNGSSYTDSEVNINGSSPSLWIGDDSSPFTAVRLENNGLYNHYTGDSIYLGGTNTVNLQIYDGSSFVTQFEVTESAIDANSNPINNVSDPSNDADAATKSYTDDKEKFSFTQPVTQYDSGLSNEEIFRLSLQSGETLEIQRVELQLKGGGSSGSMSVDVYDNGAGSAIDSTTAGSVSTTGGTSNAASTVLIRISNSTGSTQNASVHVTGVIH